MLSIRISKDGQVSRGTTGPVIGTVTKKETDFFGRPVVKWFAHTTDGVEVASEKRTRSEAARDLDRYTTPPAVTDAKIEHSWSGGGRQFISAFFTWEGHTAGVSRYAGEDGWTVDYFTPRGQFMPTWSNGSGSRVTASHVLKPEQAALVDAATAHLAPLLQT